MNLLRVFSLLLGMALVSASCSDKKEAPLVPLYPYEHVELTITEEGVTSTSCSFNVQPSDEKAPYLCLYVKQDIFTEISKEKLPEFLMNSLKKQAQEQKTDFEAFVAAATLKGTQKVELKNLAPGSIYELVAFAVSGVTPAKKSTHHFFQTHYVEPVDCTIEALSVKKKNGNIVLDMKPSVDTEYWYIAAMAKPSYENALQSFSKEDIFMTLFGQQANGMTLEEITENLLIKGPRKIGFKISAGIGDCVWMAAVLKPFKESTLVLASQVSTGEFNPDKLSESTRSAHFNEHVASKTASFLNGYLPIVGIAQP